MEPPQQRLGDAPRALDLVGRGGDLCPELAGAGDRVWTALDVHAPPQVDSPVRPTARALSTVSSAESSRCWGGQYESWFNTAERALAALGAAARHSTACMR